MVMKIDILGEFLITTISEKEYGKNCMDRNKIRKKCAKMKLVSWDDEFALLTSFLYFPKTPEGYGGLLMSFGDL